MNKSILKMTQMAVLAALSLILVTFIHFPIFPNAAFLEYDMADVPVLIGSLIFGPIEGLTILLIVSLYQAFLLGANGWVGFVMHFIASGALVLLAGGIFKFKKTLPSMITALSLGTLAMAAIMIPMNLTLTVYFLGTPKEVVEQMLWIVIVPFNLIKAGANSVLSAVIYYPLVKIIKDTIKK